MLSHPHLGELLSSGYSWAASLPVIGHIQQPVKRKLFCNKDILAPAEFGAQQATLGSSSHFGGIALK
jgi:hypothetical protein